jgi:hypothetical protein
MCGGQKGMSAFDDWYSGFVHIYPISQQDVDYMEQAFYAGMERAADPIDVLRQTLLEVAHAQQSGAGWYTKGHNGLYQQVALWVRKGTDAINDFDNIRKEIE